MLEKIAILIVGWLFGILSPVISYKIQQSRKDRLVKAAIQIELEDLNYRLMLFFYRLLTHVGKIKKENLDYMHEVIIGYTGPFSNQSVNNSIKKLSELSDEQLSQAYQPSTKGLRICRIETPYIQRNIDRLSHFSVQYQQSIFTIQSQLLNLNEEISFSMADFEKTFIPGLSDDLLANIISNLNDSYEKMANRAVLISKLILSVEKRMEK